MSGFGFILSGLGGVCAAPALYLKTNRTLRLVGVIVLVAAVLSCLWPGLQAYWGHLAEYSKWVPSPRNSS